MPGITAELAKESRPTLKICSRQASSTRPCICLHPTLWLAAVGCDGQVAEYDLASGCKLGSTEATDLPLVLQYTSDGTTLVGLTKNKALLAWETQLWKRKTLLQVSSTFTQEPLLVVAEGSKPPIILSYQGSRELFVALTKPSSEAKAKDRFFAADVKKALFALAGHPVDATVLFQFHEDASVSASSLNVSQRSLVPIWSLLLDDMGKPVAQAVLTVHLYSPGIIHLLIRTSNGKFTALESRSQGDPECIIMHDAGSGLEAIGTGYALPADGISCFFKDPNGLIVANRWRLSRGSSGRMDALQLSAVAHSKPKQEKRHISDTSEEAFARAKLLAPNTGDGWQEYWQQNLQIEKYVRRECIALTHQRHGGTIVATRGPGEILVKTLVQPGNFMTWKPHASTFNTGLDYWSTSEDGMQANLPLPPAFFLVKGIFINRFTVHDDKSHTFLNLNYESSNSSNKLKIHVHKLCHSIKQNVILLFGVCPENQGNASSNKFTACPADTAEEEQQQIQWLLPGCCGDFVGQHDQHFCILSNDRHEISIYPSSPSALSVTQQKGRSLQRAGPSALARIRLLPQIAVALFRGPAWPCLPRQDGADSAKQGLGVVMWSSEDELSLIDLRSDVKSQRLGAYSPGRDSHLSSLRLKPQEHVMQAAWQDLLASATEGSILDDTGQGKASVVGAVLTSNRLLLVTASLQILVTLSVGGTEAPITSILWIGPALVFTDTFNQVKQLSWDGRAVLLCSLAGELPSMLIAALPDRLILLRGVEAAFRNLSVLEPLLHGWACLAALGVLPGNNSMINTAGGVWRAHNEMRKLTKYYDTSNINGTLLETLMMAGCADVALALSRTCGIHHVLRLHQAAVKAAAGQWQDAISLATQNFRQTIYYPRPPAQGAKLRTRLVALARHALAYGQVEAANHCMQAAGHWQELLPLCALQGNFSAISSYAAMGDHEAAILGKQLCGQTEATFRRNAAVGAKEFTEEWRVAPELSSKSLEANAVELSHHLSPSHSNPVMYTTEGKVEGRGQNIAPLNINMLEVYTGCSLVDRWRPSQTSQPINLVEPVLSVVSGEGITFNHVFKDKQLGS